MPRIRRLSRKYRDAGVSAAKIRAILAYSRRGPGAAAGAGAGSAARLASSLAMARTLPERGLSQRGLQYNLHRFLRWRDTRTEGGVGPTFISCNFGSSGTNGAAFNFSLNQVSHHLELVSLYDAYRIDKIELWFDYTPDAGALSAVLTPMVYPKMWIKRDYDDITVPTLDVLEQSNQAECLRFTSDRTTVGPYYLTPAISSVVYDPTASGAYTPAGQRWRQWLDTGISGRAVPHYGVKMVAQGLPSTNLGAITMRVRFHLSFKNVR